MRQARTAAGLSQARLASRLGERVAQTTIARYEAGGSMPKPERMAKLAAVLGKSEAWLRGLEAGSGGVYSRLEPERALQDWTESHTRSLHLVSELDSLGEPGPKSVLFFGAENREARTAYLIQWALRLAREGRRVSYFYLDGWAGYFASELVASAFGIEVSEVRHDHVKLLEKEGLFHNLKLFSSADQNFFEFIHSAEIKKNAPQVIFIDGLSNLSRLSVEGNFALPRREEIYQNLAILKNIAVSDRLTFVAAEYMRRFEEGDSSSYWSPLIGSNFDIFLDLTDALLFLNAPEKDRLRLEFVKNRDGHLGAVNLQFNRATRQYSAPPDWRADSKAPLTPKPARKEPSPRPTTAAEARQSEDGFWYDEDGIAGFSLWDSQEG